VREHAQHFDRRGRNDSVASSRTPIDRSRANPHGANSPRHDGHDRTPPHSSASTRASEAQRVVNGRPDRTERSEPRSGALDSNREAKLPQPQPTFQRFNVRASAPPIPTHNDTHMPKQSIAQQSAARARHLDRRSIYWRLLATRQPDACASLMRLTTATFLLETVSAASRSPAPSATRSMEQPQRHTSAPVRVALRNEKSSVDQGVGRVLVVAQSTGLGVGASVVAGHLNRPRLWSLTRHRPGASSQPELAPRASRR
jgi:hypothetical protein